MKHNLTGRFQLLNDEDQIAYAKFALAFIEDLEPSGTMEEKLVEAVIEAQWRLVRIRTMEEEIFQAGGADEMTNLTQLSRYEAAQHRIVTRSLADLRIQQKLRRERELEQLAKSWESTRRCTFDPKADMYQVRQHKFGFVLEKSLFALAYYNTLIELRAKKEAATTGIDSEAEPKAA